MNILTQMTRRGVLACQATAASLMALPSVAAASIGTDPVTVAATGDAIPPALPPRWDTATAVELAPFVGQRFRVKTQAHGNIVLKLVAVEPALSGTARPAHLPRREGVTAVFESPEMAPLVADGDGLHRVSHPRIGSADLYMTAAPRRFGGHHVSIVLN
jgi:hypothetical protein